MNHFLRFIQKPLIVMVTGSLFGFLLVLGLRNSGNLEILELTAYDLFIRLQPILTGEDSRITVIEITEKDIQALGSWPLTDGILAIAIDNLIRSRPRAIGVDIYRDLHVPPGTSELNHVFVENPHVIGVMTVGEKGVPSLNVITGTEQEGFGDILVDRGGVVRRALLFLDDGQKTFHSFPLRLASLYLQADGIYIEPDPVNPEHVRLKNTTIRPVEENTGGYFGTDARGYQFLIDYRSMGTPFRRYSFSDLMAARIPSGAITDKIILLGVDSQSVKDHFFTPLSRGFEENQQVSGIVLHGHIINQLLRFALDGASPITTLTEKQETAWLFAWSFLGAVIGFRTRSAWRFSILMAGGSAILFFATYAVFLSGCWIPLVPPALSFFISAVVVTAYLIGQEKKDRAFLMQIFSKHVSKEIAEIIWQQRDQFLQNGRPRSQKMTVTTFFSDLKGFTTASEKMDPQDLIEWLNTYMESMATLVMSHGGVVDNYVGDGLKADFGFPLPVKNEEEVRRHAMNAVSCALAMEKEIQRLNSLWGERNHPAMGVRVGIYTGTVVAGLLGSSERLKYTTIGDAVNIASRLESYDKEVGKDRLCRILIGDSTLHCLHSRFRTEKIGEVNLKGKDDKIIVHCVVGEDPVTPNMSA
jgi:adenylate cyclase